MKTTLWSSQFSAFLPSPLHLAHYPDPPFGLDMKCGAGTTIPPSRFFMAFVLHIPALDKVQSAFLKVHGCVAPINQPLAFRSKVVDCVPAGIHMQ